MARHRARATTPGMRVGTAARLLIDSVPRGLGRRGLRGEDFPESDWFPPMDFKISRKCDGSGPRPSCPLPEETLVLTQQDAGLDMLHDFVIRQKGMGQQIFREVS